MIAMIGNKISLYLAILTYLWFLLVILTGLRVIKAKVSTHKRLALIALILATVHGMLMLYLMYF